MAAAIGQPVNVPLIIRALAGEYYQFGHTSLCWDEDFLLSLDAGTDEEDPTAAVSSYLYPWWQEITDGDAVILCEETVKDCLEHHNAVAKSRQIVFGRLQKSRYTWNRDTAADAAHPNLPCTRCRLYRSLVVGMSYDLADIRHHLHGLEVSFEGRSQLTTRRASGFYQLYNVATLKEERTMDAAGMSNNSPETSGAAGHRSAAKGAAGVSAGPESSDAASKRSAGKGAAGKAKGAVGKGPARKGAAGKGAAGTGAAGNVAAGSSAAPSAQSTKKGKGKKTQSAENPISVQLRLDATHELTRLRNEPEMKWTCGPDLVVDDILQIVQDSIAVRGEIHSGYVESLPPGDHHSGSSEASYSFHSGPEIFSPLSSDIYEPPELTPSQYPRHFQYPPLCHDYNETKEPTPSLPSSWCHPAPPDYVGMPPPRHETSITPAASGYAAFSDLSDGNGDPDGYAGGPSNIQDNAAGTGTLAAFSDLSDGNEDADGLGSTQGNTGGMRELTVFSDLSDEDGNGGESEGNAARIGRMQAFSDLEDGGSVSSHLGDEEDNGNAVTRVGYQAFSDVSSAPEDVDAAGAVGFQAFSDLSSEEEEEMQVIVPDSGQFTSECFTTPIPESWLKGSSSDVDDEDLSE